MLVWGSRFYKVLGLDLPYFLSCLPLSAGIGLQQVLIISQVLVIIRKEAEVTPSATSVEFKSPNRLFALGGGGAAASAPTTFTSTFHSIPPFFVSLVGPHSVVFEGKSGIPGDLVFFGYLGFTFTFHS